MTDTTTQDAAAEPAESLAVLTDMAYDRFGAIPPDLLAEHVLAAHPGAE